MPQSGARGIGVAAHVEGGLGMRVSGVRRRCIRCTARPGVYVCCRGG
jgi:hypothetical protein